MARDPQRIQYILEQIGVVWELHPDYRLGQLISMFAGRFAVFYLEDDELLRRLRQCPACIDEPCIDHVRL